jgi:hypothetical protein
MEKLFKVIRSSESTNGGFVTTLETELAHKCPVTGEPKTSKKLFAIKTPVVAEVGKEVKIELNDYEVHVYESKYIDEKTGEERTGQNNWLHRKVA